MDIDIKKQIVYAKNYLGVLGSDLECAKNELNRLHNIIEEKSNNSIKDINNFKRELKRDGLYTEELEQFIEQYIIYYNK